MLYGVLGTYKRKRNIHFVVPTFLFDKKKKQKQNRISLLQHRFGV